MSKVSPVLRRGATFYSHWCPGCEEMHIIYVGNSPPHPNWSFDGNVDAPTFNPSVRITYDGRDEHTVCHYFLHAGQLQFCGDCTHALAGKTVPLPPLPNDDATFHHADEP